MDKLIKSKFNLKENFTVENIPKSFESITEASIHNVKSYCLRSIKRQYNDKFPPQALKSALVTIFGEFDYVYAKLEGDYSTRLGNLQTVKQEGIGEIQNSIPKLRFQIVEHNDLFQQYADYTEKITGHRPTDELMFGNSEIKKIEDDFKEIQKDS